MTAPAPLPVDKLLLLATGLAGSFLVGVSAQFPSVNLADIQGGLGADVDPASWIVTIYTMASLAGVVASVPLIRAFGLGRYLPVNALVFAAAAAACANATDLGPVLAFRAIQGFAGGGFGPAAFVAVFMVMGGARLAGGVTVLAFVLLLPATIGPVASALVQDQFGWQGLFAGQALIGLALAAAAIAFVPVTPPDWSALKTDWVAIFLLSLALALAILVLSQGTRRFWFESDLIRWATAGAIGGLAGFAFLARFSPRPIMMPSLLLKRHFGLPIALNFLFRVGLVLTAYLVPQFFIVVQGYRPIEIAGAMLWAAIPQILALPLAWQLMQRVDPRTVATLGLVLTAFASLLVIHGTSAAAAPEFRLTLALLGVGQMLFIAPVLVMGSTRLTPPDLPTASLAFNATTLAGTTAGTGLFSHLVTEREKFHSNQLTESVSLFNPFDSDRLSGLAASLGDRLADDNLATRQAAALTAALARREAWVLSFNDAFLLAALLLAATALGALLLARFGPLRRPAPPLGETP